MSTPCDAQPLVSVIVPAYNASATVERTLASVVAQTYRAIEIIVIDDGSTDATPDLVAAFAKRDARIRLISQQNGGVASARNRGLREAHGAFVAPIDADDVWHPENLAKQVAVLTAEKRAFSFAASYSIDQFDVRRTRALKVRQKPRTDYVGLLQRNWVGNGSAAVFRKDALVAIGGYDETLRARGAQGAEDWKVALQLAAKGPGVALPDELIGYRDMPNAMSMDPVSMTRSTMLVLDELRRTGPRVAPWHFWRARTTIHIGMFYRWIYAGRWRGAMWCLAKAYLANPLWFLQQDARDFLFKVLAPHVLRRLTGLPPRRGRDGA